MFGLKFFDLISLKFWFTLNPGPINYKLQLFLTWLFGGILILGVIFRILTIVQRKKIIAKIWRKFYRLCLTMGLIGFLLLFFFYEGVAILGARFWFLVWLLILIIWLVYILIYLIFKIPKIKKEREEKKQFEKYLPKSK